MKNIGSRAQVFHKKAMKTKGGLTIKDLRKNIHGEIVSIKQSNRMKGSGNPLRKAGYLQTKKSGIFGPKNKAKKVKKLTNKKSNNSKNIKNLFSKLLSF